MLDWQWHVKESQVIEEKFKGKLIFTFSECREVGQIQSISIIR